MAAGAESRVRVCGCWGKALPCEGGGRSGLAQLPWGAVRSWGLCPCPDGIILEPMGHNSLEKSPTPGNKLLENLAACPSSEGLIGTRSSAVLSVRERTLRSLFVCLFVYLEPSGVQCLPVLWRSWLPPFSPFSLFAALAGLRGGAGLLDTAGKGNAEVHRAAEQHHSRETIPSRRAECSGH